MENEVQIDKNENESKLEYIFQKKYVITLVLISIIGTFSSIISKVGILILLIFVAIKYNGSIAQKFLTFLLAWIMYALIGGILIFTIVILKPVILAWL